MSKHSIKSQTFLLFLGVAMMVSACNNASDQSVATPNPTTSLSNSVTKSPASQRSQTLNSQKLAIKNSAETKQTRREDYKPILLSEIGDGEALVGKDPKAIALQTFRNNEPETGKVEATVNYPQPNLAVVIITQIGLADDSVRGIRYRTEFVPNTESASTGKQWKLVWAGSQVICQPGRGHQDWSTKLCL